jgi:microcompartment protein CcmL/EutN
MQDQKAIGVIETCGMPAAIVAADLLEKGADVQVIGLENTDAGRISVLIRGETGAVKVAIQNALTILQTRSEMRILGYHVIPCPDRSTNLASLLAAQRRQVSDNSVEWLDD